MGSLERRSIALLIVSGGLAGCGASDGAVGSSASAIAGGTTDATDTAVVGFLDLVSGTMADLCSGSLIAQNAVLTARHCVSNLLDQTGSNVDCATTRVSPPRPAVNFFVTTDTTLPTSAAGFLAVREIDIPPTTTNVLCGDDIAILILASNLPGSVAQPLVPVLTGAPAPAEGYSAVGYGSMNGASEGVGTRRRRDGLTVSCVGSTCNSAQVAAPEFVGGAGICPGDSGGPALDSMNQIIGIASRGGADCSTSIYGDAAGQADWIRSTVVHASTLGGYTPPAWAMTAQQPSPPVATSTGTGGGCSVRGTPRGDRAYLPLLLLPLALLLRRTARL